MKWSYMQLKNYCPLRTLPSSDINNYIKIQKESVLEKQQ